MASFMAARVDPSDEVAAIRRDLGSAVQVAAAEALEVEGDVAVARRPYGGDDGVAPGHDGGQLGYLDLDACRVAVVADPHLREPEPPEGGLRPLDAREHGHRHLRAVRDPAGEAGGGRLAPRPQAEQPRRRADVVLGVAGGDEREHRPTLLRGALPG